MIPADLVEEAARFVADYEPDYEFTRWTEQNWFDAFRYALSMLVLVRPGEFTQTHRVKLQPGSRQTLPSGCDRMLSTVDPLREVKRENLGLMAGRPDCTPEFKGEYKPTSYSFDKHDHRAFYVHPDVPDAADAHMTIACSFTPWPEHEQQDVDVDNRYRSVVLDFMLWYAFGFDTESVPSRNRAQAHFEAATKALGVYRDERDKLWSMHEQEIKEGGS